MGWSKSTRIKVMLGISGLFFVVELSVGIAVSSLALQADAWHMLNDIMSLAVGLYAVIAAQRPSTDRYSFGWLRAEILGAFANAVFLVALCVTIVLESITRFIEPPIISNPMLVLIVGCFGLASNIVGFCVLEMGGNSHDPHDHDHEAHNHNHDHQKDHIHAAEEGRAAEFAEQHAFADETGGVADILPDSVVAKAAEARSHIRWNSDEGSAANGMHNSPGRKRSVRSHRRRTSSSARARLSDPDSMSIHPASFRQGIIEATRSLHTLDAVQSEGSDDEVGVMTDGPADTPHEASLLVPKASNGNGKNPINYQTSARIHESHNHSNLAQKAASGGAHAGHNHGDMGMRAMVLHVLGDALGNAGVIVAALIIWLTDWSWRYYADPAVSLFITVIILHSTLPFLKATARILVQATPEHLDVQDIKDDIQDIPGVVSCHHVHIWQLSDKKIIASLHIEVAFPLDQPANSRRYMDVAKEARSCLHGFGIHEATIQPEFWSEADRRHKSLRVGMDGSTEEVMVENDSCLLECVDDCQEGGSCCGKGNSGSKKSTPPQSSHGGHDGHDDGCEDHDHDGHSHGHDQRDGHSHGHGHSGHSH